MNRLLIGSLFALALAPASLFSQTASRAAQPTDYAYGMTLTPLDSKAVQTVLLPEELYRGIQHADLRDLRVFNGAGEEVPHAVRQLVSRELFTNMPLSVSFFAIHGETPDAALADLALHVKRSSDGRVLEVKTSESAGTADDSPEIVAYIFDRSSMKKASTGLHLRFADDGPAFLASCTLESSNDLSAWTTLVPRATLARLEHEGAHLDQDSLAFPSTTHAYLRLRWLGASPDVRLEDVRLDMAAEWDSLPRRSVRLPGTLLPGPSVVYEFPSPGPLPVDRLQVHLPEPNTLIETHLSTAPEQAGPWTRAVDGRFFRMTQGAELTNTAVRVPRGSAQHARWWRMLVLDLGGGLGSGTPELELFYYPEQLAFVARGAGPFTLAYGSRTAGAARFDWQAVTQTLSAAERDGLPRESATIGEWRELAGAGILVPPPADMSKTYLLWGVLIAGVLLLGGFTWKLARQLK